LLIVTGGEELNRGGVTVVKICGFVGGISEIGVWGGVREEFKITEGVGGGVWSKTLLLEFVSWETWYKYMAALDFSRFKIADFICCLSGKVGRTPLETSKPRFFNSRKVQSGFSIRLVVNIDIKASQCMPWGMPSSSKKE